MNSSSVVQLAALVALATACAQQPARPPRPDETAIRSALSAQLTKFGQVIAAKDAAGIANMFTENGTWILPDASTFTGRPSIEAGAKNFFSTIESFITNQTTIDKLIVVSDSEAVTFAHGDYTLTEKGKPPAKRVNPVADHWKQGTDGIWRVTYEINADGAAPAAPVARP